MGPSSQREPKCRWGPSHPGELMKSDNQREAELLQARERRVGPPGQSQDRAHASEAIEQLQRGTAEMPISSVCLSHQRRPGRAADMLTNGRGHTHASVFLKWITELDSDVRCGRCISLRFILNSRTKLESGGSPRSSAIGPFRRGKGADRLRGTMHQEAAGALLGCVVSTSIFKELAKAPLRHHISISRFLLHFPLASPLSASESCSAKSGGNVRFFPSALLSISNGKRGI